MQKELLVNVGEEETRVAVLEDKILVEIYLERSIHQRLAGNIYKGRVEDVLPGMQAAFVNIGLERNAFLYVEDAIPQNHGDEEGERYRPNITDVLKEGQDIIVQVAKEPAGTKGARVTTHLTIPGRYLVLMPYADYVGVSRRIENDTERDRLRQLGDSIKPDKSGLIIRTVAEGVGTDDLEADLQLLLKLWRKIENKSGGTAPNLLYRDLELIQRILRDLFAEDIDGLIVDSRYEYEKILDLMEVTSPSLKGRVSRYEQDNLFEKYGLEGEITRLLQNKVWLKCGGYLVIDQTEALTAIDVNTGKFVGCTNLADTVLQTNLEAAVEIARQLRLRNIGGIIIVDFIDMPSVEHQQQVLKALEEEGKKDRVKTNVLGLTALGLVEMTRKKVRQTLNNVLLKPCPYCEGKGRVLSEESVRIKVKAEILKVAQYTSAQVMLVETHPAVSGLLIGTGGVGLDALEAKTGKDLIIRGRENLHIEEYYVKPLHTEKEIETYAQPVKPGQIVHLKVEEPHAGISHDGIGRVEGFIIDIDGGGAYVGQKVPVKIEKVFRTYAKGQIVAGAISLETP